MSPDEIYAFQYFMPQLHLKAAVFTGAALTFWSVLAVVAGRDNGFFTMCSLFFTARAFWELRTIVLNTGKTILTISPQGILDSRFGPDFIPWPAIESIDTVALPTPIDPPQSSIFRPMGRGIVRLLVTHGAYGKTDLPNDYSLFEYRDRRSIKIWLRASGRVEQMTPAARLRIKDKADGKQQVTIALSELNISRAELLELMASFHERYGDPTPIVEQAS